MTVSDIAAEQIESSREILNKYVHVYAKYVCTESYS